METEQTAPLTGRIHSVESFGTVDGPGIRFVVFFQGCPMRCAFCHNPDTWAFTGGQQMTADELLDQYEKNKSFYKGGGITATGGEPLAQLPFLTELFQKAKQRGIHTCLDTSGIFYNDKKKDQFAALFAVTDLVLLDFKHSDEAGHKALTGQPQAPVLAFAAALEEAGVPMVARHVVVPGRTDGEEHLHRLGRMLGGYRNLIFRQLDIYFCKVCTGINRPFYCLQGILHTQIAAPVTDGQRLVDCRRFLSILIHGQKAGGKDQENHRDPELFQKGNLPEKRTEIRLGFTDPGG